MLNFPSPASDGMLFNGSNGVTYIYVAARTEWTTYSTAGGAYQGQGVLYASGPAGGAGQITTDATDFKYDDATNTLWVNGPVNTVTAAPGTSTGQTASTAFVQAALGNFLPLAGGTMTGTISYSGAVTVDTPAISINRTWNNAGVDFNTFFANITDTAHGANSRLIRFQRNGSDVLSVDKFGTIISSSGIYNGDVVQSWGRHVAMSNSAVPAGGTQDAGLLFSNAAHFGLIFGSGAPTAVMARGSMYLRSDGAPYYNNDGTAGGWLQIGTGSGGGVTVSDTAPTVPAPINGQLWWNSSNGQLFLYYSESGTASPSSQWVAAAATAGSTLGTNYVVGMKPTRFNATGNWTPDPKMLFAQLTAKGGGGSGGNQFVDPSWATGTGGGGEGAMTKRIVTRAQVGAGPIAITIGAGGGPGGAATGATTSIGSLLTADGGGPGSSYLGGVGGSTGTNADEIIPGQSGQGVDLNASGWVVVGGTGGGSGGAVGVGPGGAGTSFAGNSALANSGGGGGGATGRAAGPGTIVGGGGGSGYVTIVEYLGA